MNIFWRYLECTNFIHLVFPPTSAIKVFMVRTWPLAVPVKTCFVLCFVLFFYVNLNGMLQDQIYWHVSHSPQPSVHGTIGKLQK